jgi:hypothetical protein
MSRERRFGAFAWTSEQIDTLHRMAADGCSSGDVAALFKITRNAVMGKSRRLGIMFDSRVPQQPATYWTDEKVARLREMVGAEHTYGEIAKALGGVSRCAVIGKANRLGLQMVPQASPPKRPHVPPTKRSFAPATPDQPVPSSIASSKPLPRLRVVETGVEPRILADCTARHCRWPLNDPGIGRMDETLFCAAPKEPERVYCDAHQAIAGRSAATAAAQSAAAAKMRAGKLNHRRHA